MKNKTITLSLIALLSSIGINANAQDVEGTVINIEPAYKVKYERVYSPISNVDYEYYDQRQFQFTPKHEYIQDKNFITVKDKSGKIYDIEADSKYKVIKGQQIIIEING